MSKREHLHIIKEGPDVWNQWRERNLEVKPDLVAAKLGEAKLSHMDLSGADLRRANLEWADLRGAKLNGANLSEAALSAANLSEAELDGTNLSGADLRKANLSEANLNWANLSGAHLCRADLQRATITGANLSLGDLSEANLRGADLRGAHLSGANLNWADFSGAYLAYANLMNASLVETNFNESILTDCRIYGAFSWGLKLNKAEQSNLIITPYGEPTIGIDNFELAQFIYLLLYNEKIHEVIDTIGKKIVLILGRFPAKRKPVLHALKDELHRRGYTSILFESEPPVNRDLTETISHLVHFSRFIIAEITDPRGIPQEFREIVSKHPSVPVQPLLQEDIPEAEMSEDFMNYPWFLKIHRYIDLDDLLPSLGEKVIEPAETMAKELQSMPGAG